MAKTGEAIDTKNPGEVDEREFNEFINTVVNHFHLCKELGIPPATNEKEEETGGCITR
jgi:hypothetical protein